MKDNGAVNIDNFPNRMYEKYVKNFLLLIHLKKRFLIGSQIQLFLELV